MDGAVGGIELSIEGSKAGSEIGNWRVAEVEGG